MRAGDVVHVPANLNLMRSQPYLEGMSSMVVFETKMPKKALYLGDLESNNAYCLIEYGENTWIVDKKHISLVEKENDC